MTEPFDDGTPTDGEESPKRRLRDYYRADPVDGVLLAFQELANSKTLESMGVTVTVNGMVISGSVISHERYLEELFDTLRASGGGGGVTLADGLKLVTTPSVGAEQEEELAQYLHLKDARVWMPSGPGPQALWRCKMTEIDGWMLGVLGQG